MSEDLFESVRGVTKNEPLDLRAVSKGKVNFHVALTPKVVGSDKIKKNFAAAIDRHQQLKVHQDYLRKLIRFAEVLETEVIRPISRLHSDSLVREIRLLDQWNDRPPHRLSTRRKEGLQSILLKRLDDAILDADQRAFGFEQFHDGVTGVLDAQGRRVRTRAREYIGRRIVRDRIRGSRRHAIAVGQGIGKRVAINI